MVSVAKVAVVSNLPQLDRLFDYQIPVHLVDKTFVGSRVKVPFGKGSKLYDGFVFEIGESSAFPGRLSHLSEVVGDRPLLAEGMISVLKELAARSASSVGELLRIAVPAHMPRTFKVHSTHDEDPKLPTDCFFGEVGTLYSSLIQQGERSALISKPGETTLQVDSKSGSFPNWVVLFSQIAFSNLQSGKSTILAVPDFRDYQILIEALDFCGIGDWLATQSPEQSKSKSYESYLRCLDQKPCVVVGSRSVALAPAYNLGTLAVFDEGDGSFYDQSAPYLNAREVALVRQSLQGHSLVFASHSRSTDIQRLVESGYLREISIEFARPRVSVSEPGFRVDSQAYKAIKKGLESGSVLVQVASRGESTALFCSSCDKRILCGICSGPVWVDGSGHRKCRWCNAFIRAESCDCGSSEIVTGRAGSTRTASELGKAFPSSRVIESTGDNRVLRISEGKNLVIATAGAEPFVGGGYQSVVILDAQTLLSRQHLRASEEAVRLWANAVSKISSGGEAVLVGLSGALGKRFCLWQHVDIAKEELASRRELLLPPALRLGSVSGSQNMLGELSAALASFGKVTAIGPAPFSKSGDHSEWRLIFKYNYADTVEVAKYLRAESIRLSGGKSTVASSGRSVRALKIRMTDGEVI